MIKIFKITIIISFAFIYLFFIENKIFGNDQTFIMKILEIMVLTSIVSYLLKKKESN
jgi:hypothetical protein